MPVGAGVDPRVERVDHRAVHAADTDLELVVVLEVGRQLCGQGEQLALDLEHEVVQRRGRFRGPSSARASPSADTHSSTVP